MEHIVIEVNNSTAKKWRFKNAETKHKISEQMDKIINIMLDKSDDEFWPILEKIRLEAENKGFNDNILNQILNEEA